MAQLDLRRPPVLEEFPFATKGGHEAVDVIDRNEKANVLVVAGLLADEGIDAPNRRRSIHRRGPLLVNSFRCLEESSDIFTELVDQLVGSRTQRRCVVRWQYFVPEGLTNDTVFLTHLWARHAAV
ncbi:MAG TPA: hypothetical protein VFF07_04980 [Actinomycetota bacterium]|nr:hypothetical protein [Actinomycetota bacterium]